MVINKNQTRYHQRSTGCCTICPYPNRTSLEVNHQDCGVRKCDEGFRYQLCSGFRLGTEGERRRADYTDKANDRRSVTGIAVTLGVTL